MRKELLRTSMLTGATALMALGATTAANASHFRGGSIVPTVDANGLLTTTTTTFWAPGTASNTTNNVSGVGNMAIDNTMTIIDTSDVRFDRRVNVHTIQLPNAGTFNISYSSCCRIDGIRNRTNPSPGSTSVGWQLDSTIVWDGQNGNTPILFDFSAIQPEVVRNSNYNDSLGATSGNGGTLSYNQTLNTNGGGAGLFTQPPGFNVDPVTGALTIPAASTNTYLDNDDTPPEDGGDYIFGGNIMNSDGSSVEFDWLFDAVAVGSQNLAPNVSGGVINALVGDMVAINVTGTDNVDSIPDDVMLTLDGFFGPGVNLAPSFTPGGAGDPTAGNFTWDTTGSAVGTYILNIRGSDGRLSDVGTYTINLTNPGQPNPNPTPRIPEAASIGLFGLGLLGMGLMARRRRRS